MGSLAGGLQGREEWWEQLRDLLAQCELCRFPSGGAAVWLLLTFPLCVVPLLRSVTLAMVNLTGESSPGLPLLQVLAEPLAGS